MSVFSFRRVRLTSTVFVVENVSDLKWAHRPPTDVNAGIDMAVAPMHYDACLYCGAYMFPNSLVGAHAPSCARYDPQYVPSPASVAPTLVYAQQQRYPYPGQSSPPPTLHELKPGEQPVLFDPKPMQVPSPLHPMATAAMGHAFPLYTYATHTALPHPPPNSTALRRDRHCGAGTGTGRAASLGAHARLV